MGGKALGNCREGARNRDRNVRLASLAAVALFAGPLGPEVTAYACGSLPLGIQQRTVWPGPDGVPTNARLLVSYQAAAYAPTPALGSDVVLLDGGREVPIAPPSGNPAVLLPMSPLLANHTYELADRRTVPCLVTDGTCSFAPSPQVFSTFTTGAGPDTTAPTFGGIQAVSIGARERCDGSSCCGPYDLYRVTLRWDTAMDDVAGTRVVYRVYRRDGAVLSLVADRVPGTTFTGVAYCSGWVWAAWGHALPPGSYVVRAVDGAGNEDANTFEREVPDPCTDRGPTDSGSTDRGCAIGGRPSSRMGTTWLLLTAAMSLLPLATRPQRPRRSFSNHRRRR